MAANGRDPNLPIRPPRAFENYVGSRFLLRLSNEITSVKYNWSTRFSTKPKPLHRQQSPLSSKNPLFGAGDGGRGAPETFAKPRPVIPSAIVHLAIPGYDGPRETNIKSENESSSFCGPKVIFVSCLLLALLGLIVGIASSGQNGSRNASTLQTSSPVSSRGGDTRLPPTSAPSVATRSPTLLPTLSPTRVLTFAPVTFAPTSKKTSR